MDPKFIETCLKNSFAAGLPSAVERASELKFLNFIPGHWFSRAVSESLKLYVNGYFYAVIVTSQAYIEALGKYLCKLNGQRATKDVILNWKKLVTHGVADSESFDAAESIYHHRNDFHHLNPTVETDYFKLKELALSCLDNIFVIESKFFGYSSNNGAISVDHPKYWPKSSDNPEQLLVYIRNI